MIRSPLAQELKQAGLHWFPQLHDFFMIPGTELQDQTFVISDMTIDLQKRFGRQLITFNGALDWSLDYILTVDAVWLPTEEQLRQQIQDYLAGEPESVVELVCQMNTYTCQITILGKTLAFASEKASDAYGRALLYILKNSQLGGQNASKPVA